jgi:hypothetical protein
MFIRYFKIFASYEYKSNVWPTPVKVEADLLTPDYIATKESL